MSVTPDVRWYVDLPRHKPWAAVVAERVERDVTYLNRLLENAAPGVRVLDVGCGRGARAIALAKAGYDVVAVDPSAPELAIAREHAAAEGVAVRWLLVDFVAPEAWLLDRVDAALCMHCVGWGSDAQHRKLFRAVRRLLVVDGLLAVEQSPPWPEDPACEHDPLTGRTRGTLKLSARESLAYDRRVFSPSELSALVRECGFRVESVESEHVGDRDDDAQTSSARIVAKALPSAPEALAIASWRTPPGRHLDLRYAPDEAPLLEPSPAETWQRLVLGAPQAGAEIVGGYAVDDPYGGARAAVVMAGYFDWPVAPNQITFAAGVTSLLHSLADLAYRGPVTTSDLAHGDLGAWAVARGSELRFVPEVLGARGLVDAIEDAPPALVHLDRPTFTGRLVTLAEVHDLAAAASRVGAAVVIDESAASYLGGPVSAATVVPSVDNLVVLRGFTKGYSLGGLRAAFAVASRGVAARVHELVPPLQTGELALQLALRLLAGGDVFANLRAHVEKLKPRVVAVLRGVGLEVIEGEPCLPWVAVTDRGGFASRLLDERGIRALAPTPAPGAPASTADVLRLTLPLSAARLALFERMLDGGTGDQAERGRRFDGTPFTG